MLSMSPCCIILLQLERSVDHDYLSLVNSLIMDSYWILACTHVCISQTHAILQIADFWISRISKGYRRRARELVSTMSLYIILHKRSNECSNNVSLPRFFFLLRNYIVHNYHRTCTWHVLARSCHQARVWIT